MASQERFHSLDAVRAFALLLGVALHASMSFVPGMLPGIWATVDATPSVALGQLFFVTHIFRMALFFVIAGFFARLLYTRAGAQGFWINRIKRIAVPLIVGWCVLFPAYAWVASWGMSQFAGKIPAALSQLKPPPGFFPFMHLWFLYMLLLVYPTVLLLRGALVAIDRRGAVRALVDRSAQLLLGTPAAIVLAPIVLGAPLALTLYTRATWVYWGGVPAQDMTYYPQLPAMVGFGTAMIVGWILHRRIELLRTFENFWLPHLVVALTATLYCCSVAGTTFSFVPPSMGPAKALFAVGYVVAMWSWIFAILGLGLKFCAGESRVRRYVADSSYWLYLAHLPVVAAFDIVVRTWPVHWSVKFAFVLAASFSLLFASYHLLVRPTFIGEWLNSRKYPRHRRGALAARTMPTEPANAATAVAQLTGVTRRYGKLTALDDITLDLRRGELMALLGPNGAGKTSAIALWLGLAEPDCGQATLLAGSPLAVATRRGIGVMMQDVTLPNGMKVRELIEQTASYYANPMSVSDALSIARITELAGRYYDKLSGGQKRQVQFALAICGRPEVLFLDEPSVGMDVAAREHLWTAIRQLRDAGCSILLTTHYLEEAEMLADRVIVLAKGRVVASGSVAEVRSLVSRRQIRCDSALPANELAHWPGVVTVSRADQRLTILATDAETVLRRLLASDHRVANIEVQQAGLAEAFVELTKEAA